MKKTAVEQLIDFLEQNQYFIGNDLFQEFARVKEVNKEQIIEAGYYFLEDASRLCGDTHAAREEAEDYFNKTYKK